MKPSNHPAPRHVVNLVVSVGVLVALCQALPAWAQLGLGAPNLFQPPAPRALPAPPPAMVPLPPALPSLRSGPTSELRTAPTELGAKASIQLPGTIFSRELLDLVPLQQLRATTVRELLSRHADLLEADPMGEPVRKKELLWISPPTVLLKTALALGFSVLREESLPELDLHGVVLRPPPGLATAQALEQLRALDPKVEADFNHVYTPSGEMAVAQSTARLGPAIPKRVGLVDGGVDQQHAALRGARLNPWGCDGVPHPSAHGTAVASLLVGRETGFSGASAAGTTLYAADIYCGQAANGAVETIARALAWMVRENVAVVNISLVGPSNRLLERSVQALVRKGFLLVAAVGNDGPAAPPLYPAAYAGVVGVTAVTRERKPLPEAAQGQHVMFSALGVGLPVAEPGGGYFLARGTSFAAPRVAGLLALSLVAPDPQAASAALARLAASAVDLGEAGRDPVFGYGLVGFEP